MKFLYLSLSLISLLFIAGCDKDDDETPPPPDPRQSYIGDYESESHEAHVLYDGLDTTLIIPSGSEIEIELLAETSNEVEMEMDEFIRDAILAVVTVPFSVDFEDDVVAEVSGNEFELEDTEFEILADGTSYPGEITGEGELDDDELTLEYEFTVTDGGIPFLSFSGEVVFEKE